MNTGIFALKCGWNCVLLFYSKNLRVYMLRHAVFRNASMTVTFDDADICVLILGQSSVIENVIL